MTTSVSLHLSSSLHHHDDICLSSSLFITMTTSVSLHLSSSLHHHDIICLSAVLPTAGWALGSGWLTVHIYITSFSRRFYPKRLTYVRLTMYTHFTFTLMAQCTSGAIRGSVSCSRTLRQGIELATF